MLNSMLITFQPSIHTVVATSKISDSSEWKLDAFLPVEENNSIIVFRAVGNMSKARYLPLSFLSLLFLVVDVVKGGM